MAEKDLKYHSSICDELVDMFADGTSITQVCAMKLKIARSQYYVWKDTYPEFRLAAERGEQMSEAFHEKKLEQGADGLIEGFSAPARIFLMKSRFRETYGEQKAQVQNEEALAQLAQILYGNKKSADDDNSNRTPC